MPYRIRRPAIFPIGPSIAYFPLTKGLFALLDWDDALALKDRNWYASKGRGFDEYYACTFENDQNYKLHRMIIKAPEGLLVDHIIAGNTLDNRRANLRLATHRQNAANRRARRGISTSKGVSKYTRRDGVTVFRPVVSLGEFLSEKEACDEYMRIARIVYGEFAFSGK
jgi:hypothetical protein